LLAFYEPKNFLKDLELAKSNFRANYKENWLEERWTLEKHQTSLAFTYRSC